MCWDTMAKEPRNVGLKRDGRAQQLNQTLIQEDHQAQSDLRSTKNKKEEEKRRGTRVGPDGHGETQREGRRCGRQGQEAGNSMRWIRRVQNNWGHQIKRVPATLAGI